MPTCCVKSDLNTVINLFFAATQLPITTFTHPGAELAPYCRGFFRGDACLYKQGEIEVCHETFYLLPICPCCKKLGTFVIGPYSTKVDSASKLSYRPPEVWAHLLDLLRSLQNKYSGGPLCRSHCLPVARAQSFVEERYDQEISLEGVANHLGLNHTYLSTLFKEETGHAFTHYVQEIRVERSKELLTQSDLPILEIALSVGFASQNYYSRIFKKLTGFTPSEFRKQALMDRP